MPYSQDNRMLRVETPLGKDKLLLRSVQGFEEVSRTFGYSLECYSEDSALAPAGLLGKTVTVTIKDPDGKTEHHTNGLVQRVVQQGKKEKLTAYRIDLVPWVWFLSLTRDSRIFQGKNVLDIVTQVFRKSPDAKFRIACSKTYPVREFCVQYRESDLDFISRLLEEEGIFYYFEHEKGSHTLVLTDLTDGFKSAGKARFAASSEGPAHEGVVLELEAETVVHTGKVTLRDYDYLKPTTSLESKTGGAPWEHYDYPGRYTEKDQGERLARIRLETAEAQQKVLRGSSTSPGFRPGRKLSLTEHYRKDLNAEYALLEVRTTAIGGDYTAWDEGGFDYRNYFVAIPSKTPYHPPRVTPRPRIEGAQTAVVVGPAGEEIWVDKYGRVKVQFHWDRDGKKDDKSSCWVRVSTTWAGKNWGAIEIPRVGEEVIVDFLEGDPDQPIITGRVYNADRMPPFKLPDNKTQSGLLTRSSRQGSSSNANELRFEDKKGSEEVYLHAEKDIRVEAENNRDTTITNDDTRLVEKGNDSHTIKKGKQTITVFGDQTITIDQGNQSLTIKMGNQGTVVKMGNVDTDVKLGKHTTKAMQSIELKVGTSSLKLDPTGVTIKGMMIKIEGQTMTQIKGLMTKVEGSAMLQARGGITMIN